MKKQSLLLMGIIALVSGCSSTSTVAPQATTTDQATAPITNTQTTTIPANTTKTFTLADVAKHATASDCWIVIKTKVFDVTSSIAGHPGGEAILKGCGKDSTNLFSQHSSTAQTMLANYFIGDLK